jgi:predicted thioesterase
VGETVSVVATVAAVDPTRLVCEVAVRHAGGIVARGSFEQRTVQRETFRSQIEVRRTVVDPPAGTPGRTADERSEGSD